MKLKLDTCGLITLFSAKTGKAHVVFLSKFRKPPNIHQHPLCFSTFSKRFFYQLLKFYTFFKFKFFETFPVPYVKFYLTTFPFVCLVF